MHSVWDLYIEQLVFGALDIFFFEYKGFVIGNRHLPVFCPLYTASDTNPSPYLITYYIGLGLQRT